MSEKTLFFTIHTIGIAVTIVGLFLHPMISFFGIVVIGVNSLIMGVHCDITFK